VTMNRTDQRVQKATEPSGAMTGAEEQLMSALGH
jgi:hypothetical protein